MTTSVVGHKMHNELLDQLESIGQWWPGCDKSFISPINAREVMTRLTELRTSLRVHFDMEEVQGLLPNGTSADPRFLRHAEQLLDQHDGLMDRLNAVITSLLMMNDGTQTWSVAKEHFDEFRKQLQAHERAEIDLLQAACGDNLGVVD